MTLINGLKAKRAQSSVEYLALFAIVATLTLLSITKVFPDLRAVGEDYFKKATAAME